LLFCAVVPTPLQAAEAGRQVFLQAEAAGYVTATATLMAPGTGPLRVTLEGTVRDQQGDPVPWVRIRSAEWPAETRTNAGGRYQLAVEEPGGRPFQETLDFTLAPQEEIQVETNPATGLTYQGLVADGASRLRIDLYFPTHPGERVPIALPTFGQLEGETLDPSGLVGLDGTGSATLTYLPPADIPRMKLIQRLPLADRQVWSVVIPLHLRLAEGGKERTAVAYLALYRPPVLLVSDLLGDPATWEPYVGMLRGLRFDALRISLRQESLLDQAQFLGRAVQRIRDEYAAADILLNRLDLVALGTGGLAARGFLGTEPGLVRKLIQVGTPNAGVGPLAELALSWYETWAKGYSIAAGQLAPGSPYLNDMAGVSLPLGVEVGSLYGDGVQGDGLVLPGSAALPGRQR
jgi:pimeloyl-ACP methyl ester carboxylesterase